MVVAMMVVLLLVVVLNRLALVVSLLYSAPTLNSEFCICCRVPRDAVRAVRPLTRRRVLCSIFVQAPFTAAQPRMT